MRLSLSEISTVGATFEEDVTAYAAAGFDAIGIWEMKLPPDDEANRTLLAQHGLEVSNCIPTIPSILPLGIPGMEGPDDVEERIQAICLSIRRLAAYAPESVVCLTGPVGGRTEDDARAIVVDALRRIGAAAVAADVPLAFEPVHCTQRASVSFVNSLRDALSLLDEAGLPGAGIMFDVYHVWDDPSAWDTIGRAAYRIHGVHISDWPAEPGRTDRLLPGEGMSGTKALIEALDLAGFSGSLDVEIFSDPEHFWGLAVDEAARRAYAAASALVD
jgi:sugar phosphate isomerase/epimerase